MILVVCPNLAIDVTLEVDALSRGAVHRTRSVHRRAGGKGVNFARAAKALGEPAVVLGFAGGERGSEIARHLAAETIDARLVPVEGESRTCTIVLEPNGVATVVNERGPRVEDSRRLVEEFESALGDSRAVAFMGSLPPGVPTMLYADLLRRARDAGTFSLVDASGAALTEALSQHPSLVKPNRAEAEALLSRRLESEADCREALDELRRRGAEIALISRGAEGVVLSSSDGMAKCASSATTDLRFGNPTGAGDALAAGLTVGRLRGFPVPDMVRLGVAAATASLAEGFGRFRARDVRIDAVSYRAID